MAQVGRQPIRERTASRASRPRREISERQSRALEVRLRTDADADVIATSDERRTARKAMTVR